MLGFIQNDCHMASNSSKYIDSARWDTVLQRVNSYITKNNEYIIIFGKPSDSVYKVYDISNDKWLINSIESI